MELRAHGKLMLFGEYLVLKGSKCLAIPLKYGQSAEISPNNDKNHRWQSTELGKKWFSAELDSQLQLVSSSDEEKAEMIQNLLQIIQDKNPKLFQESLNFSINADFPRKWGFGSSSTLLSILSQWSGADPYELLKKSFGGSGYDIACATANSPIVFDGQSSAVEEVEIKKGVRENLLFVYSGKKQSSKAEIQRFEQLKIHNIAIEHINKLISSALCCNNIAEFERCMERSEALLAKTIQAQPIKNKLFNNYPFAIKSLGAWGGDFFMASFRDEAAARRYFDNQGYPTQFTYAELIRQK